jgi:hypothetical protein
LLYGKVAVICRAGGGTAAVGALRVVVAALPKEIRRDGRGVCFDLIRAISGLTSQAF